MENQKIQDFSDEGISRDNRQINNMSCSFPDISKYIHFTSEATYSITNKNIFNALIICLKKIFIDRNNLTLIDATANIGSDTLKFAVSELFRKIYSIELNEDNFNCLKKNIDLYPEEIKNICEIHYGNCFNIIHTISDNIDIIYFDPPWRNNNSEWSRYTSNIILTLDNNGENLTMIDIFNKYKDKAELFIFKLPFNYNFFTFSNLEDIYNTYIINPTNNDKQSIRFLLIFKGRLNIVFINSISHPFKIESLNIFLSLSNINSLKKTFRIYPWQ